eukprot:761579-Hanusia_phi.AAC.2
MDIDTTNFSRMPGQDESAADLLLIFLWNSFKSAFKKYGRKRKRSPRKDESILSTMQAFIQMETFVKILEIAELKFAGEFLIYKSLVNAKTVRTNTISSIASLESDNFKSMMHEISSRVEEEYVYFIKIMAVQYAADIIFLYDIPTERIEAYFGILSKLMKQNTKISKYIPLTFARMVLAVHAKLKQEKIEICSSTNLQEFMKQLRTPQCDPAMAEIPTLHTSAKESDTQQSKFLKVPTMPKCYEMMCKVIQHIANIVNDHKSGKDELTISALQSIPILLEISEDDHAKLFPGLSKYLDLVIDQDTSLQVRKSAAALLGLLSAGDGKLLLKLTKSNNVSEELERMINKIRGTLSKVEPSSLGASIAKGCLMLYGFLGIAQSKSEVQDLDKIVNLIVSDLSLISVQFLSLKLFELSSLSYAALQGIARARHMKVIELICSNVTSLNGLVEPVAESIQSGQDLVLAFGSMFADEKFTSYSEILQMSNAAELVCEYFIEIARYLLLLPKESNDQFEAAKISIEHYLETDFNDLARDIRSYDILSGILLEASLLVHSPFFMTLQLCDRTRIFNVGNEEIMFMPGRYPTIIIRIVGEELENTSKTLMLCFFWCCLHSSQAIELLHKSAPLKDFYSRFIHDQTMQNFRVNERSECTSGQIKFLKSFPCSSLPSSVRNKSSDFRISVVKSGTNLSRHQGHVVCNYKEGSGQIVVFLRLIRCCSLTQIVVTLLALAEKHPEKVAPSLELIIVSWYESLKEEIKYIPYIPQKHAKLRKVDSVSALILRKQQHVEDVASLIKRHVTGLCCDDEVVQTYALLELKSTLRLQQEAFFQIFDGNSMNETRLNAVANMKELISVLLRRCAIGKTDLRIMSSECLGEIGAIDPSRIGLIKRLLRMQTWCFADTIVQR